MKEIAYSWSEKSSVINAVLIIMLVIAIILELKNIKSIKKYNFWLPADSGSITFHIKITLKNNKIKKISFHNEEDRDKFFNELNLYL